MRRAVAMDDVVKGLGAAGPVAMIGYVFNGNWARRNRSLLDRFFAATRQAKDILVQSPNEWQRLAPRISADVDGKGHAKRDIVEWMLPPLWPWKVMMLPARGPRPKLKGESQLTLRLMDDVQIPQVNATNGPDWHFFGRPSSQNDGYYRGSSYGPNDNSAPQLAVRQVMPRTSEQPMLQEVSQVTYADYISRNAVGGGGAASSVPVFVLKRGMVLEVGNYTYQSGRINYELASGGTGVISTDEVDWSATTRVNSQRGVRVTLRGGHPSESGF